MGEAAAEQLMMPKHGDFCWTEIVTNDLETCKSFYCNVFGWEMKKSTAPGESMEFQEFSNAPNSYPMGGMFQMKAEMDGSESPIPHFLNYIMVDNVDETISQAFDLGARIIKPAMDFPNVGRFAVIQDPTGGIIAFITLKGGE